MKPIADEVVETDVLVIGTGGAGTRAALEADSRGVNVVAVCKGVFNSWSDGCTSSGPSVFTAVGYTPPERQGDKEPDDWKVLFDDMLRSGRFMNNQRIVERHAKESSMTPIYLESLGVVFDRTEDGRSFIQMKYGGHSKARTGTIIRSGTNLESRMGYTVLRAMCDELHRRKIKVIEELAISRLLTAPNGAVNGAVGIHIPTGDFYAFKAKAIVIAAGGYNKLFGVQSSCPFGKTGDGGYMAYEVGAEITDLEFFQFHPGGGGEFQRALGARLYNCLGERFMRKYSPDWKEVASRDFVSRGEFREARERGFRGEVWLSHTHMDPEILLHGRIKTPRDRMMESRGIDLIYEPGTAYPMAHYGNGGIRVDVRDATKVPGLYAAGEVTAGTHGGNRLGSNSLPSILIEGRHAGLNAAKYASKAPSPVLDIKQIEEGRQEIYGWLERKEGTMTVHELEIKLENVMRENCFVEREEKGLKYALQEHERAKKDVANVYLSNYSSRYNMDLISALELPVRITCGEILIRAALMRNESRAAHMRRDYPTVDNENWLCNIVVQKVNGKMTLRKEPIEESVMTKAEWLALGYYGGEAEDFL